MSKKLFVGSLSWNTNDDELRRAFEGFGELEDVKVISDRDTGRSRGFGFVTFMDNEGANKAIAEMNGAMLDGRAIVVNEAKERGAGGGGGGGGGRGGDGIAALCIPLLSTDAALLIGEAGRNPCGILAPCLALVHGGGETVQAEPTFGGGSQGDPGGESDYGKQFSH